MSVTGSPFDLSADQQEEACVAFGMQPYSLKTTQANNFSEKAASVVLEYLKSRSIDLQFPIIDSGNDQLPLDYDLLDNFRTGKAIPRFVSGRS